MTDFEKMTRDFLLGESRSQEPSMLSHIQALEETLSRFQPRSQSDFRRMEVAKNHLRGMRRHARKLQQECDRLQEKLKVLEEEKLDAKIDEDYS